MSDQPDEVGQQEAVKRGGTDEPLDAEGHATRYKATEGTDEPPSDEAGAEGHLVRGKSHGAPGTDEPPSDDSEGHVVSRNH